MPCHLHEPSEFDNAVVVHVSESTSSIQLYVKRTQLSIYLRGWGGKRTRKKANYHARSIPSHLSTCLQEVNEDIVPLLSLQTRLKVSSQRNINETDITSSGYFSNQANEAMMIGFPVLANVSRVLRHF